MKNLPPKLTTIYNSPVTKNTATTTAPVASAVAATANPGWLLMDSYSDISFFYSLDGYTGGGSSTVTELALTIEASNSADGYYADITKSGYNKTTNAMGGATITTALGVNVKGFLDFDNIMTAYIRARLTTTNGTSNAVNATLICRQSGGKKG